MKTVREYTVHIDDKKRITLRGTKYKYYHVKEYENGCYVLEPRELATPESVSDKTLKEMDQEIAHFKKGTVSDPIDLTEFSK